MQTKKVAFSASPLAADSEATSKQQNAGATNAGSSPFWATAPSLRQLPADPVFLSSATLQSSLAAIMKAGSAAAVADPATSLFLTASASTAMQQRQRLQFIDVDGPVNPEETLIRYDIPIAPKDPHRSLHLRKRLGLAATGTATTSSSSFFASGGASFGGKSTTSSGNAAVAAEAAAAAQRRALCKSENVDPNVRTVLDSFLIPRRWVDAETGVEWVQHASPFPASRTETQQTRQRLHEKMQQLGAKHTGTCPIRTVLIAECMLEVMRQMVAECWERGLLMLRIHAERVAAAAAHREWFESRVGHAMRLALKGAKDAVYAEEQIAQLKEKVRTLEEEEQELKTNCAAFVSFAEEQVLIEDKKHSDALSALKKEGLIKRNQLEQMLAVPPSQ